MLATSFLRGAGLSLFHPDARPTAGWFSAWWTRAWRSGLESFIRNAAFAIMVLRLVNEVQGQKSFWVANQLIWGWLLVPVLALGELIRRDVAARPDQFRTKLPGYLLVTTVTVLGWMAALPILPSVVNVVLQTPDPAPVMHTVFWMIGFYVVFAFNHIADSLFYGLGRTDFMLYQTIFVSVGVYGVAFCLYHAGIFVPSPVRINCLFGLGIVMDSSFTFLQFRRLLKTL